ncbi:histidinol-phosphate transaminase [Bacillus sp. 03113]|uniref:histidinol-phosphate transaminase n=1 Tax=Bacillus sp. 03113 TaxID=2578211 RepID=UPI0011440A69|nr:histidinol-phosphate transaminase [Bacillus sp. 03113]
MTTKIIARKNLENISAYVAGKPIEEVQRELGLERIIKLASNENPYGYSPLAKEAMLSEMEQTHFYPEGMAPALAAKLAEKLQVEKDHIIIGNGSDEIIRLLTKSYIEPNDEVIMPDVTFPRYETNTLIEGGTPVLVPLIDGIHDLQSMYNAITEKTKMIVICNPNNPTGTIVEKAKLTDFINKVPKHILLIMDEAYYEYVNDNEYLETIPFLNTNSNLVILRTFSKIYGLASLRIGYGIMHPSIIEELVKVKDAFNTNRLAQAAALASLDDDAFVDYCATENEKCRKYIENELTKMELEFYPSHANFLMIKLNQHGKEIFEGLLKQGIIIRSGHLLGYDQTIRVSIGSQPENEEFIKALQKLIG